jgi:CxxC motif-containing protein (DUF1111 family)
MLTGFSHPNGNRRTKKWITRAAIALCAMLLGLFSTLTVPAFSQAQIALAGGSTTIRNRTSRAYEQPAPNMDDDLLALHTVGDRAFDAVFVTPPANVNPGLGPLFNNASCAGCHIKDGRGMPEKGQLLVRVSAPRETGDRESDQAAVLSANYHPEAAVSLGNAPPVPGLGTQIQEQSIYGHQPEAKVELQWQETTGSYADGQTYQLRSPVAKLTRFNGGAFPSDILTSLRIPSPVFGLGLLEAVPEELIRQQADPDDRDRDGISGRVNLVWDEAQQKEVVGRFGWKANNPNLLQQSASAYVNDMGVTNPLFPDADGSSDIDQDTLKAATVYVQTLAVPARGMVNEPQVQRGEKLFSDANCAACHVSTLRTGAHELPILVNQTIHPYTDLLLHDMGTELADNRPDFRATGKEWRTSPLWGVGLTHTVLPYSGFLHDGRARTLEEAILWHGGEADGSRTMFKEMSAEDRAALIQFLRSL